MMKLVISLALLVVGQDVAACLRQPEAQYATEDELIARTDSIALAKAVRADAASNDWDVLYTFRTLRVLKGDPAPAFQLLGRANIWESSNSTFDNHKLPGFWNDYSGREGPDTACRIRPGFAVGGTYLIFLDKPYHLKSFEMVRITDDEYGPRDRWLAYVEQRLGR